MKQIKAIAPILVFILSTQILTAQSTSNKPDYKDFDKVEIENVNGQIEIELGKPFAISIPGNESAGKQVNVSKVGDKLLIQLDKKYSGDWKKVKPIVIKISMPEISILLNNSNADVSVKKFAGRYAGIYNNGNGNITLAGTVVDFIEIENTGNGNVESKNINAQKVTISKTGNGDVSVKTNNDFKVKMAGNGDIINYGQGKAIIDKQSGNGKVVYKK